MACCAVPTEQVAIGSCVANDALNLVSFSSKPRKNAIAFDPAWADSQEKATEFGISDKVFFLSWLRFGYNLSAEAMIGGRWRLKCD